MKLLVVLLIMGLSSVAMAQVTDTEIIDYKDWSAKKVGADKVTQQPACIAQTTVKDKDSSLQVYAEGSPDGGHVEPMVQIVTTDIAPALGAVMTVSPGNRKLPMSVSLSETKIVQKEVMVDGQPVLQDVEQQVFLIKFKNKKEMINLIKAKNSISGTFFNADGDVATMSFSLRGSHKSVTAMVDACL